MGCRGGRGSEGLSEWETGPCMACPGCWEQHLTEASWRDADGVEGLHLLEGPQPPLCLPQGVTDAWRC